MPVTANPLTLVGMVIVPLVLESTALFLPSPTETVLGEREVMM